MRVDLDPRSAELLQPLESLLDDALRRLPDGPAVPVRVGEVAGIADVVDGAVVLSPGLLGPEVHHALEPEGPARLDRWRRAACAVLEGVALLRIAGLAGVEPDREDWRQRGLALHLADAACPDLQLAAPALLRAASAGCPGDDPETGVAAYRALEARGDDPVDDDALATGLRWIRGEGPDPVTWLALGRWVLGPGLAGALGLPVDVVRPVDIPTALRPWSWARIEVPAHPRGGIVERVGDAAVEQDWATGGEVLRTLGGALAGGGELRPTTGGPVGTWENVSAEGFGQVFGVRGITWMIRADGRLEIILADAFAGPAAALDMADQVGTSGLVPGRWQIVGRDSIRISGLSIAGLSMHGREGAESFAVPAGGMGVGQALLGLQDQPLRWRRTGAELRITGPMFGGPLEMRFRAG